MKVLKIRYEPYLMITKLRLKKLLETVFTMTNKGSIFTFSNILEKYNHHLPQKSKDIIKIA